MTVEQELAQAMATVAKAAVAPILADMKALQDSLKAWDARWNDIPAMRERIAVLEVRAPIPGPPGPPGEKGDCGDVGPVGAKGEKGDPGLSIKGDQGERGEVGAAGKDGAPGLNGKDGAPGLNGKDGADGLNGKDGKDGADGLHGKDGAPGVDGKDGAPGLKGKDGSDGLHGKDGANGADGKDGIGVMDAMLDRAGQLVVTFSDGRTKAIGTVVGKDGANGSDGQNGKDVDPLFVQDFVMKELAKWPKPKDGEPGKNGSDGLSPDDFDWDFDPETRNLSITLMREGKVVAERKKVLRGMRIYRKVYEAGRTYEEGDVVTWDGSEWTALTQTKERPGNANSDWKLTVKHGEKGARGADGKPGRDGRDLTQLGPDGRKW